MFQIGSSFYENFDYTYSTTFIFLSACTISWYFKSCLVNIESTYKMPDRRAPKPEEYVYRRAAHTVVSFREKLYLWGGYMELPHVGSYSVDTTRSTYNYPPEEIYVYDIIYDTWVKRNSSGRLPPSFCGSSAAVHKIHMYIFGGYSTTKTDVGHYGVLWRLNLETFSWELMKPGGFSPYPCDKSSCWVYKDRLYIFGGYGPRPYERNNEINVRFLADQGTVDVIGWLDQFCYLDIESNTWVWPKKNGQFPSPRAAHAATVLGDKAYIFGGRYKDARLSDLYCVDLITNEWTSPYHIGDCSPPGRSWHTFNAITKDKIILYGGFSTTCQVFNDVWLLDVKKLAWMKLPHTNCTSLRPRLWHSSAQIRSGEIVYLGGIANNLLALPFNEEHVEEMLILRFSPPTLFRTCLDYVTKSIHPKSWEGLPNDIREILMIRSNPTYIHGQV